MSLVLRVYMPQKFGDKMLTMLNNSGHYSRLSMIQESDKFRGV